MTAPAIEASEVRATHDPIAPYIRRERVCMVVSGGNSATVDFTR